MHGEERTALVEVMGRRMVLDLRFPADEIEPIFSGGCWAGSVVWSASLVLCDVIAQAAAAAAPAAADTAATNDATNDGSTAPGSKLPAIRG